MEHGPGKRRLLWIVLSPKTGPKWVWKGPVDLSTISHRSTASHMMSSLARLIFSGKFVEKHLDRVENLWIKM
jgi:hypothetical protein